MDNTFIILGAIVVFGTLVVVVAYLYRESALASGKGEINVLGLFTIKLEGKAQKQADSSTPPAIEQSASSGGRISGSGLEIIGGSGHIKQEVSEKGIIENSAPKIK